MNQILENSLNTKSPITNNSNNTISLKKFKIIFWISLLFILIFIMIYFLLRYHSSQKEKLSKNLADNFSIHTLYSNNTDYISKKITSNLEDKEPFVVGLLKIDKINIMYPILSKSSEELLKISPCRFYGPMPNEVGNLCIAGHNYANKKHFGNLSLLNIGDIFQIYDLNGNTIDYIIYNKLEVSANDTSCINQNTNNIREVTLITCNTIKGNRLVLKAKENR